MQSISRACFIALIFFLISGCVSKQIGLDMAGLTKRLSKARLRGAMRCCPKQLAFAESHLAFALGEAGEGTAARAWQHAELAKKGTVLVEKISFDKKLCPPPYDPDRDKDGIRNEVDKCPDKKGPAKWHGCPDTDGDGIPDHLDACPKEKEDPDGFQDTDGCPDLDNDKDGVTDKKDKCPLRAGPAANKGCPWGDKDSDGLTDDKDQCPTVSGPVANKGCPWPDTDKDGIPDHIDKCPKKPGVAELQGCPRPKYKLIIVTKKQIKLTQKVYFASGKARIKRRSFPLLNEVSKALRDRPGIIVRIEGHTDHVGPARYNLRLSRRRARSVRRYMIDQGIAPERMIARGYGEERPIESNSTKQGRAANRRVEFHIIKQ